MYEVEATSDLLCVAGRDEGDCRRTAPAADVAAAAPADDGCAVLIVAARGGDRDAFARLYEIYGRVVHGVLLARVPRAEADDLVQDVFLHAYGKLKNLREPAAFGPWLMAIARNRATDYHRRARETTELNEAAERVTAAGAPRAEANEILGLIRELPEAYREPLVLRFVEGMTGPEIAERTGLAPASVRVNLHRGMKLLRELLARNGAELTKKEVRRR